MKTFITMTALGLMAGTSFVNAADKPVVASIVFQGDQFMKSLQAGMRSAAEKAGAEILETNIDGDQAKESQAIDTYIARKVNAIVIAPVSAKNSAAALKRARDAGITVVAVNGGLTDDTIAQATFSTSNKDLGMSTGKAAGAFIKTTLAGKANVAILGFKSLLPEQSGDRTGGFKTAAEAGNQVKIVTEQDAWLPEKAVSVATDILTANPDVNVIYAANEGGTVGAMQAVRNAGKAGSVYVFGIDGSEQLAKGLMAKDNVLQAVTAQSPFDMGAAGVNAALSILKGEKVEKQTTVPAILLSRAEPEGIKTFVESLKK
ncbi:MULTISPECIES: substrate-binding domain-containing protein [unclassified Rhizobium]|uniref:substrate-binding domain-containing protein n=1 Tax=unclassified Rhizobium TaxID=2613769 RepID=UPI0006981476|nr:MULTISPECIES: substrate-binding domain-containing protein [unclassified Rhizobium]MBD8687334.1 substrate-binding domain-containing protein [Rhizobium sp. CFBP 13644]MBD8691788.1 substrate-binding domain-containing protein [Rhizobium sp. CFBP 13717]